MAKPTGEEKKDLGSTALNAVSQLVGLQLFSRAFTFILNQALVRVASPEVFGTATIQFELLLSTILFLAREGVRNALLRSSSSSKPDSASPGSDDRGLNRATRIANIAHIPIILGAPLALIATFAYHYFVSETTRAQPHFSLAISLYALAATLELLSEPLHIRALSELKVHIRVRAEASAVAAKAVTGVALIVLLPPSWSLVAFAGGQVAYGAATLGVFLWAFWGRLWSLRLQKPPGGSNGVNTPTYFDETLLNLSLSMTLQSVFKHFLTEGDRFLVSKFSELEDQGGYAIATNYGSLIARIVFQPIEETSRIFFSKLLSIPSAPAPSSSSTASLTTKKNSDAPETIAGADEQRTRLGQAASTSQLILLLYTHLSLVFIVFGPPFVPTLASFLLPRRYVLNTSAPAVLQAYCLYLPVMALNGFLEALMASVAEPRDLARQSRFMGAASILFVLSAVGFSRLGGESGGAAGGAKGGGGMKETGMVYANVLNLGSRAIYGWFFMSAYFRRASAASSSSSGSASLLDGWKCLPPRSVWLVSAVIGIILRASASHYGGLVSPLASKGTHLAIGVLHFVIWIIVCWWTERDIIAQLVKLLRARRAKAE